MAHRNIEFITSILEENSLHHIFQNNLDLRNSNDIELDSIELETRLINSIIQNDLKTFDWIFKQMDKVYFVQIHSDRLTSLKYKYIALISLLTRVCINNAVGKSEAYALSDSLIQQLENIESLSGSVAKF